MEILDYITIAVFAAGIMFVGSLFSSTGKNMKSFFAGGGNVPWWISGLSLFMGFLRHLPIILPMNCCVLPD